MEKISLNDGQNDENNILAKGEYATPGLQQGDLFKADVESSCRGSMMQRIGHRTNSVSTFAGSSLSRSRWGNRGTALILPDRMILGKFVPLVTKYMEEADVTRYCLHRTRGRMVIKLQLDPISMSIAHLGQLVWGCVSSHSSKGMGV